MTGPHARAAALMLLLLLLPLGAGAAADAAWDREVERLQREGLPETVEARRTLLQSLRKPLAAEDGRRELRLTLLECGNPVEAEPFLADVERRLQQHVADADRLELLDCAAHLQEALRNPTIAIAIASYGEAITLAARLGKEESRIGLLGARSGVLSLAGQHAAALDDALQAYRLLEARGATDYGNALMDIGIAYRRLGDLDAAKQYLQRSREQSERLDRWDALATELLQLGYVDYESGRLDPARTYFQQVVEGALTRSDWANHAAALLGLAMCELQAGQPGDALRDAAAARQSYDRAGSHDRMPDFLRGRALAALGRHEQALALFDAVYPPWKEGGQKRYLALLHQARADTLAALNRHAAAFAELQQLLALREELAHQQSDQRTQWMRHQFDAGQREQRIEALQSTRRWQLLALALSALLALGLLAMAVRWRLRSRRFRDLALTDALTGVANRRRVEAYARRCMDAARLGRHAVSLVSFDIDHFKRVNDNFGHAAGDAVIQRVARTSQQQLRQGDLLGRTGGEEFLIVLPGASTEAARAVAERVRLAVQALDFSDLQAELKVTISLGLTTLEAGAATTLAQALEVADAALYRAKQGGRNQVQG